VAVNATTMEARPMTTITRTTLLATVLALGACVSLTPPERPPWEGPDLVDDFDPDRLVGVWQVTPLNPFPDQPVQDTVMEYRPDGTVVAEIDAGDDEAMAALGDIRFRMNASWSVAGGQVTHDDVRMEAIGENRYAQLMSSVVNGARKDLGGVADLRELESDYMVMLGADGSAMRYDRVR